MYPYKLEEEVNPLFSFDTKHNLTYFVSFKKWILIIPIF